MITIYHNSRCSKSRSALQLLEERHIPFVVRNYMQQPLTQAELQDLLKLLQMKPGDLLRKGEAIYKELIPGISCEEDWLPLMVSHPQLIERPVVVAGGKAIVARPPERVLELL